MEKQRKPIWEKEKILKEFAKLEIDKYVSELGTEHPYKGIDEVETIGELKEIIYHVLATEEVESFIPEKGEPRKAYLK